MKKRALCKYCEITSECESYCKESAETLDNNNYMKSGTYKAVGIARILTMAEKNRMLEKGFRV